MAIKSKRLERVWTIYCVDVDHDDDDDDDDDAVVDDDDDDDDDAWWWWLYVCMYV